MTQRSFSLNLLVASCLLAISGMTYALEEMKENEMSQATGEGLGIVLDEFKLAADAKTYVRLTSAGGSAAPKGKNKADIYLYGFSLGGDNSSNDAKVSGANIGSYDNPIVFDVKDVDGRSALVLNYPKPKTVLVNGKNTANPANANAGKNLKMVTQVDVLPRDGLVFTANKAGEGSYSSKTYPNYLRMQVMANKLNLDGTKVNIIKTGDLNDPAYSDKLANYGKLRINYETDGFFRWSAAQQDGATGTDPEAVNNSNIAGNAYSAYVPETPAKFNEKEGLFVKDFQINMPLGSSFQPTIIDTNGDGSLTIEVVRIPNDPAIYNKHYINYKDRPVSDENVKLVGTGDFREEFYHGFIESPAPTYEQQKDANGQVLAGLTEEQGMCTPINCPDTATHATAYFRTYTQDANGQSIVDYPQAGVGEPFVPFQYRGFGVRPLNSDKSNSAGIGPNGALSSMEAIDKPTYNLIEGMSVNHLKVTLNQ